LLDIQCWDHFFDVCAFADRAGLRVPLQAAFDKLSNYGNVGLPSWAPGRVEHRCVLAGKDIAPYSFRVDMYRPTGDLSEPWKHAFSGSCVFQSPEIPANGQSPSFTVSLAEGTGWFLHT
jgi:hypothetical protein